MKVITLKDLKETACWPLNHSLEVLDKKCPKKSKYSSTKTEIDGITFHSLKESRRYLELRMLKNAGLITNLRLQKPYELNESGAYSLKYIADFVCINFLFFLYSGNLIPLTSSTISLPFSLM